MDAVAAVVAVAAVAVVDCYLIRGHISGSALIRLVIAAPLHLYRSGGVAGGCGDDDVIHI